MSETLSQHCEKDSSAEAETHCQNMLFWIGVLTMEAEASASTLTLTPSTRPLRIVRFAFVTKSQILVARVLFRLPLRPACYHDICVHQLCDRTKLVTQFDEEHLKNEDRLNDGAFATDMRRSTSLSTSDEDFATVRTCDGALLMMSFRIGGAFAQSG